MPDASIVVVIAALVVVALLLAVVLFRLGPLVAARDEAVRASAELKARLDMLAAQGVDLERDMRQDLSLARTEQAAAAAGSRGEILAALGQLRQSNEQRLEAIRAAVEQRLDLLRNENAQKLDQMRATVDEKLQATLEQRLGASFKQVSRPPRAGAQGTGRDADACRRRRRPEARADQREDARNLGRSATRDAARRGADAAAVRQQCGDRAREQEKGRIRHQIAGTRTRRRALLAARSTPSFRSTISRGCRTRSSVPTRPPRTPPARRSPIS